MQSVLDYISAHSAVMSAAAVGVLDLVFALNKSTESNGILHWIYVKLSGHEPA